MAEDHAAVETSRPSETDETSHHDSSEPSPKPPVASEAAVIETSHHSETHETGDIDSSDPSPKLPVTSEYTKVAQPLAEQVSPPETPSKPAFSHQGHSEKPHHKGFEWTLETFSLVLALVALGAIIAIVLSYNNHVLPEWPAFFSINFVVTIPTAIFKSCLLLVAAESISELKWLWFNAKTSSLSLMEEYDLASRGPRGSVRLLLPLVLGRRREFWACLGAFITVMSVAIDAVTQATVQTQSCLIPQEIGSATIARTNNYSLTGTQYVTVSRNITPLSAVTN
jgi:Protein of unknown function (DUF3176)